ncbi:Uncharacterised protein [uncultured archaeon]|nr:Uncharacterised protein [uncultured archaeon]
MHCPDYTKLDQKTFEIAGVIETNLLKFINPQNLNQQKLKFFEALERNEQYNPVFSYMQRNPDYSYFQAGSKLDTFKSELTELLKEVGRDELGIVFESEIIDLIEKIELIKSIGTENFSGNSEAYYGSIERISVSAAKKALQTDAKQYEERISLDTAINTIKTRLKKGKLNYKITLREPAGSRFAVINSRREILINNDTDFTKEMVARFIAHEIEAHIYRYENGFRQPYKLLAHGFSRETTETEEGLAATIEKLSGVSSEKQVKEYAGRLIAINEAQTKSFFDTYTEMAKHFDREAAFRLTLRAKRGIKDQTKGGALFKDALYFNGMLKVEEFLKTHALKELYYGKYSVHDLPLVKQLPGLKEPKYLPNCINSVKFESIK